MANNQFEQMKKKLRGYRLLCLEIKAKTDHLKWFMQDIYNPLSAQDLSGMPHSTGVSDQTANMVTKIEQKFSEMVQDMEHEIERLQNLQKEILMLVHDPVLTDAERMILYNRYIMGRYWEHMEAYTHYEERQARRIHNNALNKLIKMSDNVQL